MTPPVRRRALLLLAASIAILIPGLFLPVLSIRGLLTREGIAAVAPQMLDKGLNDETMATLTSMLNPQIVTMVQITGADLRKTIIDRLTPQLTTALQKNVGDVEVYQQTRSIIGSIENLYDVGSPVPATLILLFSVVVPFTKAALVGWAVLVSGDERGRRTMRFVEAIAKWSMADVFVVGLFIAYLAAEATQRVEGSTTLGLVAFDARFGPGFYWFAAYCLLSLASQQYTRRAMERE
ncbi:MAG TPA: paraquat-inducible protein A [Vicinamibacterales bacterium]|nr:paraquat-inducible protein A [Vicinamibacterales bacterium]